MTDDELQQLKTQLLASMSKPIAPLSPLRQGVSQYVMGAIITCVVTVIAVVIVAIAIPGNASIIATLVGIATPVTMALLAAGISGVHTTVNGRMSELLQQTSDNAYAQGREHGAEMAATLSRRAGDSAASSTVAGV